MAARLRAWPAEHVVKCLFAFDEASFSKVLQLQEACILTGHELLLEMLPKDLPRAELLLSKYGKGLVTLDTPLPSFLDVLIDVECLGPKVFKGGLCP